MGIATVRRVIKSLKNNENLQHKKGGGRHPEIRNKIVNSVAPQVRRDDTTSVREISSKLYNSGNPASKSTVHRCLTQLKYDKKHPLLVPMLSEGNRIKRLQWATKHRNKHWCHAVFCDGRVRHWTKQGKIKTQPSVKHGAKINIWAAFSSAGTWSLCIFEQIMTGRLFVKIMGCHLLAQAHTFHLDKWFLVMDNDPKHTSKVSRGAKKI